LQDWGTIVEHLDPRGFPMATTDRLAHHHLEHADAALMSAWMSHVAIRLAGDADRAAVADLAALDGAHPPRTPVLVVEQDGRLLAARSLHDGATVADPFKRTAHLVRLLEAHAAAQPPATRTGRFRAFVSRLEGLWERHAAGDHLATSGQDALRALGRDAPGEPHRVPGA
jgi:hypothetical protein